mgnify:FL=1
MTTPYAQRTALQARSYPLGPNLRLVPSAPAQGQEAQKVRENVHTISSAPGARGYSIEAEKLTAAVRELVESIGALQDVFDGRAEPSHQRIPLRPAFTVQATYKFTGKLKPRRFPIDE